MFHHKTHMQRPDWDKLNSYLLGEVTAAEKEEIEAFLSENPLYKDALEGLMWVDDPQFSKKRIEKLKRKTRNSLNQLPTTSSRTTKRKSRVVPQPYLRQVVAIVASIILIGVIVLVGIDLSESKKQQLPPSMTYKEDAIQENAPSTIDEEIFKTLPAPGVDSGLVSHLDKRMNRVLTPPKKQETNKDIHHLTSPPYIDYVQWVVSTEIDPVSSIDDRFLSYIPPRNPNVYLLGSYPANSQPAITIALQTADRLLRSELQEVERGISSIEQNIKKAQKSLLMNAQTPLKHSIDKFPSQNYLNDLTSTELREQSDELITLDSIMQLIANDALIEAELELEKIIKLGDHQDSHKIRWVQANLYLQQTRIEEAKSLLRILIKKNTRYKSQAKRLIESLEKDLLKQ